ncbi:ornithine carbamoyltransferase [Staphylothermus marinus F1]|uniref:Ornithine carbamoyltransferase n=1 Tax=Staphylothermus marinus (strain ATCC 43588 / DSM 3639 / JCM 9404 / F1) TaxID=399550 RepID=OTC_STAMF|nr:ornithine carbamoyltransferase [Staphylothermus marinus]A3DL27.1 RecName: Full=Ornithine carbamoyltransferase; Short=OTCase [Staphylothermus marinus F1]ABN69337.1 ornithine carbamoyltransferase [Staphylothermus marinus F1]
MVTSLKGRDFLTLADYSREELLFVLETAKHLKQRYLAGERVIPLLPGRHLAMIFEKSSTRTRISFETAMRELGGDALYLGWKELQLGRGETIEDTARVVSRYVDGIMARVYEHEKLEKLAQYSRVPVINGLSDLLHPAQALTDIYTIMEKKGSDLSKLKIVFIGDGGDNVLHSLMLGIGILGGKIIISSPKGYDPDPRIIKLFEEKAVPNGGEYEIIRDPYEAVRDADVVYTDVWVSMGQEAEKEKRIKDLEPYRVTVELMKHAKSDAVFMHCLPAHRGQEVVDEVIDGKWSIVWDQAENRKHVQKAILALIIP